MKITLQKEETFTAVAGERTLHGFTRETWHGIDRLLDPQGRELVLLDGAVVRGTAALLTELGLLKNPGFIRVPARTLPGGIEVPEFYVAERKASKGEDGKVIIDAARKPWVNISYYDAKAAAESTGGALLTGLQAMSIALDIAEQDINWTGGKVGEGSVFQGLHRGTVSSAQDGNFESPHADERRWHQLSTGERIYDFAGNAWEWMFADLHGGADGVLNASFGTESPYLSAAPYPSMEKGMGYRPNGTVNWSGSALFRGGYWWDEDAAGVFYLGGANPDDRYGSVGFRSTLPTQDSGTRSLVAA